MSPQDRLHCHELGDVILICFSPPFPMMWVLYPLSTGGVWHLPVRHCWWLLGLALWHWCSFKFLVGILSFVWWLCHAINKNPLHNICSILEMSCNSLFLVDVFYFLGNGCRATLKTKKPCALKTRGTCAVLTKLENTSACVWYFKIMFI